MVEQSYYDDVGYADSRMRNTVMASVHNEPLYIHEVSSRGDSNAIWAFVTNLVEGEDVWVNIREIAFQPIQLGYMNVGNTCYYFKRRALRQDWRQGLRQGNYISDCSMNIRTLGRSLRNLMINKYPSVEDCVTSIRNNQADKQAFTKHFALKWLPHSNSISLMYKDSKVGVMNSNLTFTLDRKFIYLKERLEDSINEHN